MTTARMTVDRREGQVVVVIDAAGRKHDVPVAELPQNCRSEGAVLDVPVEGAARIWKRARRNHAAEKGALKEAGERILRMRKRDPGGDVYL